MTTNWHALDNITYPLLKIGEYESYDPVNSDTRCYYMINYSDRINIDPMIQHL